jgi:hypothetical protein
MPPAVGILMLAAGLAIGWLAFGAEFLIRGVDLQISLADRRSSRVVKPKKPCAWRALSRLSCIAGEAVYWTATSCSTRPQGTERLPVNTDLLARQSWAIASRAAGDDANRHPTSGAPGKTKSNSI